MPLWQSSARREASWAYTEPIYLTQGTDNCNVVSINHETPTERTKTMTTTALTCESYWKILGVTLTRGQSSSGSRYYRLAALGVTLTWDLPS